MIDLQGFPDPQFQDTSSPFFSSSDIVYILIMVGGRLMLDEFDVRINTIDLT
jgi:hypothetical protein